MRIFLALILVMLTSPAAAIGDSNHGGDQLLTRLQRSKLLATSMVETYTRTTPADQLLTEAMRSWFESHARALRDEVFNSRLVEANTSLEHDFVTTLHPSSPVFWSSATTSASLSHFELATLLIHEAIHHLDVGDEAFAYTLAGRIAAVWESQHRESLSRAEVRSWPLPPELSRGSSSSWYPYHLTAQLRDAVLVLQRSSDRGWAAYLYDLGASQGRLVSPPPTSAFMKPVGLVTAAGQAYFATFNGSTLDLQAFDLPSKTWSKLPSPPAFAQEVSGPIDIAASQTHIYLSTPYGILAFDLRQKTWALLPSSGVASEHRILCVDSSTGAGSNPKLLMWDELADRRSKLQIYAENSRSWRTFDLPESATDEDFHPVKAVQTGPYVTFFAASSVAQKYEFWVFDLDAMAWREVAPSRLTPSSTAPLLFAPVGDAVFAIDVATSIAHIYSPRQNRWQIFYFEGVEFDNNVGASAFADSVFYDLSTNMIWTGSSIITTFTNRDEGLMQDILLPEWLFHDMVAPQ